MKLEALVGGQSEVIGTEATLGEAAEAMIDSGTGSLAVIEGRAMVGIVTERDIVRALSEADEDDIEDEVVANWMTEAPDTFSPDVDVTEAAEWLLETGYRHLPVMDGDELLGIVGIRDLLWALVKGA
jgi:CBS domain-containing protein